MSMGPRSLYHPSDSIPPPARTALSDRPTLLVAWWTTGCALVIIFMRIFGRYTRTLRIFSDDKWTLASVMPLILRIGVVHFVLTLGTNNVDATRLTDEDVRKRVVGSGLVLLARVLYASCIWMQKLCITAFYERLTAEWERSYEDWLKFIRWSLVTTFVVAVISVFAECRPTQKLWQVRPDPGPVCRESFAPLVTMGGLSVLTDLFLAFFVIPAIIRSHFPLRQKFHLIIKFSLSCIPIATTLYRVPTIINRRGGQPYRTLWASIEILAACLVSNAIALTAFARGVGPKRKIFRPPTVLDRRSVRPGMGLWGSDEEIARDTGIGMSRELRALSQDLYHEAGAREVEVTPAPFPAPPLTPTPSALSPSPTPPSTPEEAVCAAKRGRGSPDLSFSDVGELLGRRT